MNGQIWARCFGQHDGLLPNLRATQLYRSRRRRQQLSPAIEESSHSERRGSPAFLPDGEDDSLESGASEDYGSM
ncbi:hypothetical protein ACLOJK_008439 [Asimina triloba]